MLPGFELLFSSVQSQLRSPQDAVVSAVHWNIISAGFKLTGVGENPAGQRQCTEILPSGWNSGDIYVLQYETTGTEPNQNYLLKVLSIDGSLLLHLQRENDENVTTVELSVQEFTSDNLTSVATAFPAMERLNSRVRKSLIEPAMGNSPGRNRDQADNTEPSSSSGAGKGKKKEKKKSSLLVEEGRPGLQPRPMQPAWVGGHGMGGMDPFSVGRADLDPMAGLGGVGGGGMLMDPRHMGGPRFGPEAGGGGGGMFGGPGRGGGIHPGALPPGAIPPGARFDPFGPAGARPGPDPDHERPPSGYDDMFM